MIFRSSSYIRLNRKQFTHNFHVRFPQKRHLRIFSSWGSRPLRIFSIQIVNSCHDGAIVSYWVERVVWSHKMHLCFILDSSSSSSSSSDSEEGEEQPQREKSPSPEVEILTEQQMNELGAKIIKAEIMGNQVIRN